MQATVIDPADMDSLKSALDQNNVSDPFLFVCYCSSIVLHLCISMIVMKLTHFIVTGYSFLHGVSYQSIPSMRWYWIGFTALPQQRSVGLYRWNLCLTCQSEGLNFGCWSSSTFCNKVYCRSQWCQYYRASVNLPNYLFQFFSVNNRRISLCRFLQDASVVQRN